MFVLFLPATQLIDFPTEILIQIFEHLTVQECLLGVGRTCHRFRSIIMSSKKIWHCLTTTAEFTTEAFEVIVAHAMFFESLSLIYSQRLLHLNNPDNYIENRLLCSCVNLRYLDLSYNTSISTIHFVQNMPFLKSLIVVGCTSIDPQHLINCIYLCKTLTVLDISCCTQLENKLALELATVCKELPQLKVFRAEWSCRFTAETVNDILRETNIVELAVTPVWSPPSEWIDMVAQHNEVLFGNSIMSHIKRVVLLNFLYEDEQEEFD